MCEYQYCDLIISRYLSFVKEAPESSCEDTSGSYMVKSLNDRLRLRSPLIVLDDARREMQSASRAFQLKSRHVKFVKFSDFVSGSIIGDEMDECGIRSSWRLQNEGEDASACIVMISICCG